MFTNLEQLSAVSSTKPFSPQRTLSGLVIFDIYQIKMIQIGGFQGGSARILTRTFSNTAAP